MGEQISFNLLAKEEELTKAQVQMRTILDPPLSLTANSQHISQNVQGIRAFLSGS